MYSVLFCRWSNTSFVRTSERRLPLLLTLTPSTAGLTWCDSYQCYSLPWYHCHSNSITLDFWAIRRGYVDYCTGSGGGGSHHPCVNAASFMIYCCCHCLYSPTRKFRRWRRRWMRWTSQLVSLRSTCQTTSNSRPAESMYMCTYMHAVTNDECV